MPEAPYQRAQEKCSTDSDGMSPHVLLLDLGGPLDPSIQEGHRALPR
jgi:hypothetical protein